MRSTVSFEGAKGRAVRTSQSYTLQIANVSGGHFVGTLGVTFAPGKSDPTSLPVPWLRDLKTDLDAIADWNAHVVLTLIEPHEFELLGIPALGEAIRRRGFEWLHLPIRDVSVPDARFERAWPKHSADLRALLRVGNNVLVHCRGGLGRAGMIAARLLVEEGVAPKIAMAAVREVRPGAIETPAQEHWVRVGPARR